MVLAIVATILSSTSTNSDAAILTYNFTGHVTNTGGLGSDFNVGDSVSGSFTVDSGIAPRGASTSTFAVYDNLISLNATIGSYTLLYSAPSGGQEVQVDNNPPTPDDDRFGVTTRVSDGHLTGADVGGLKLDSFLFRLDDNTDAVFSDALVFPTSISLSDFTSSAFFLFFTGADPVSGVFDSFGPAPTAAVPEPGSLSVTAILGMITGGVVWLRRRQTAAA
jgi:hypothetical protein